jgi:hypothetical protein
MSVLEQISFFKHIHNGVPNQELAKKLAASKDQAGIAEIASHLWEKNANIQSDCLKVLYEIGYLDPALIAIYVPEFLKLAKEKNNRLVWGAMIALSRTAVLNPGPCMKELEGLKKVVLDGSVITQDNGIKTLSALSVVHPDFRPKIFPFLLDHLRDCREKDVAQCSESILSAVNAANQTEFLTVLETRLPTLTAAQARRVEKLIHNLKKK